MRGKPWTPEQLEELKEIYPDTLSIDIAVRLGHSLSSVYQAAQKLKLKKDPEFVRRTTAERMANPNHGGRKHQFKKGQVPKNKGRKQTEYMTAEAIERTKATRFQKGQSGWNHKPVGYERVNVDGYVEVKVTEPRTFKLKQRIVWEEYNGAIPKGYNVQFKDGNRQNCDIENLYIVSREAQMLRNSGTLNLPDSMVASYIATSWRRFNRELKDELLNHPELLEIKRQQIILNRTIKNHGKGIAKTRKNDRQHLSVRGSEGVDS